jgi:tRNA A-37 threonylcarbamoyl transferase component Bud32
VNDRTAAPGIVEIEDRDGVRWRVVESAIPLLFDGDEFAPKAKILRRSVLRATASRHVERIDLAGGSIVVKRYPATDPGEGILRRMSGRVPADVEFTAGRELARLGLPVAEPLASGRRPSGLGLSESIVVTRHVDGVELQQIVVGAPVTDRRRRLALIDAMADLLRALHTSGVTHSDLHLGNLLVADQGGAPRLVLIDLRRVAIGAAPDDDVRLEACASLGRLVFARLRRTERLRFLARYLGPERRGDVAAWARRIEPRALALVRAFARRRARSALGGDSRFLCETRGGVRWIVRRATRTPELAGILDDPERPFAGPDARLLKSGRSGTVASSPPFVVKRFNLKKVRNLILDRVRLSRARKSLARALVLEGLLIPTPQVLAVGEARRGGFVTRGYLVMAEIPGVSDLSRVLDSPGRHDLALLVGRAGALIATLHARGLVHRDLKASNFLVDPEGKLSLIDLDGLGSRGSVDDDRAARDIARLARDLRRRPSAGDALVEDLVRGYLASRRVADAAGFRRAVGVA